MLARCIFSFRHRKKRRRRRRLKGQVYLLGIVMVLVPYHLYRETRNLSVDRSTIYSLDGHDTVVDKPSDLPWALNHVLLRDANGAIVSRNSTLFSQYLSNQSNSLAGMAEIDLEQAKREREPIMAILRDAGIGNLLPTEIMTLPTWEQVVGLYGDEPVIIGMEQCETFQRRVPRVDERFLGVAGIFNSGSTAFGISLQANCRYPNHPQNLSNNVLKDCNGMLDQVPWAKHKMASEKYNHTIHPGIPKDHVLPIILVRDPYYWMQSMCKQGYGVRWDHNSEKHCPNLVPNDHDRQRFKRLQDAPSVSVWMGPNAKVGPSWPSLVHYWNAWYQSYVMADFPRLMVRFEDTLFHGHSVMKSICECGGGTLVSPNRHFYLLDEAKWHHKHTQNNMISAMIKYGNDNGRYRNMTKEDLEFAQKHLDLALLDLFRYQNSIPTVPGALDEARSRK